MQLFLFRPPVADEHLYYDADYTAPGKTYSKGGGFLTVPVDEFDPLFFGISPREADGMDPQHRLLLEMSWEALEHANLPIHQLEGSRTGVFIGINTNDYLQIIFENGLESIDPTMATGSTFSAAAGRISYVMGLQGPSIAVDTACSSSLVTIHMACQSLRSHESNLALAGGVNLNLSPLTTYRAWQSCERWRQTGVAKRSDANADGYGRGEGAGMVVLKRLSDALADGDRVWAVVRGSAVTQDGASGGLTVPNGPAQQAVIQQALHAAGVLPHEVDDVEAHGTGTPLGDPIELNALHATLAKGKNRSRPLYVGSVKTNIGHLEAAAGIAGFVKLVLSMHHQAIPPHINFHTPSPNIEWDKMAIEVPTQLTAWQSVNKPRIAGVSSFGFSGTNAHIIVQEGITPVHSSHTQLNRPLQWLALSARSEASLVALAQRYADLLQDQPNLSLLNLAYTAHAHREHFAYRATFCAHDGQALAHQLSSSFNISYVARVQPKVAWMFTGQGSQMVGMARRIS
ncbi:MAG UNVERIFIED_CONTAM: polyketide synthase [Anaerolineae bacterium]|jgi:acyl transferase domain-containing protein